MFEKNEKSSLPIIEWLESAIHFINQNTSLASKYLMITCSYILLQSLSQYLLLANELPYDFFQNYLSLDCISLVLKEGSQWQYLSYVILPGLLLIKFLLIAISFSEGGFMLGVEDRFKKFFLIAIHSEFVFLIPPTIKLFWFAYFQTSYNFDDLRYFSPFSLLCLFDRSELDPLLIYPLHLFNGFELIYWFVLAYQLKEIILVSFRRSLFFVASTYGIGLLIWALLITLLSIS